MSLSITRQVNEAHPALLQTNTNATCYQFVVYVIAALRAAGYSAYHVCKTAGEGQYIPPGFNPREIVGFDGRRYTCTGVSHDAVWCNGMQFDTVGGGNDSPDPIGIVGVPTWAAIPQEHVRPNNVPLLNFDAPKAPPPPPAQKILPKGEAFAFLKALDAFYRAPEGLQRADGLGPDMEGIAQWFYQGVIEGVTLEQVFTQIRNSNEWKAKHP